MCPTQRRHSEGHNSQTPNTSHCSSKDATKPSSIVFLCFRPPSHQLMRTSSFIFWWYHLPSSKPAKFGGYSNKQLPRRAHPHCKRWRKHRTGPRCEILQLNLAPQGDRAAPGDVQTHRGEEGDAQEPPEPGSLFPPSLARAASLLFFPIPSLNKALGRKLMKSKADYKEQYNDSICFFYLNCVKLFTFMKVSLNTQWNALRGKR